jgi:hypothetical protein
MDSCVRVRNGARAGSPHVAFFLGSVVDSRHTDARLGLGTDDGVKSACMQPQCGAHEGGFLSHGLLVL